jgi:NhaP-type Na+/H+ or K+/H+ antiporter
VAHLGAFLVVLILYGLVSARLAGTVVTAPMVFVSAGVVFAATGVTDPILEKASSGELDLAVTSSTALFVAEIALALLLFADASRIRLRTLRGSTSMPARLLFVGLPLTIALGGAAALGLIDELELWEAFVLAAVLGATDAALGHTVVSDRRLPLRVRQTLNVEAGLNDGLAVPFFTVFLAAAVAEEAAGIEGFWEVTLEKIGYGGLIGLGVGLAGGRLVAAAGRRGWMERVQWQLAVAAMAILSWWAAEEVGGSGFIAAFVAGLAAGRELRRGEGHAEEFTEELGQGLSLFVFFGLGSISLEVLGSGTWEMVVFAVLALTALRMGPVAVALLGLGLDRRTVAYLGWFGPRGLASIVFALLVVVDEPELPGVGVVFVAMTITVLVSVFAHGITAPLLTGRYARWMATLPPEAPELADVEDLPTRVVHADSRVTRARS